MTEKSVFIHVRLKNLTLANDHDDRNSQILDNTVNPLVWVWALEGKGYALLSYPFDFKHLSLGTLGYGVEDAIVVFNLPYGHCFNNASTRDQEIAMAC